MKRNPKSFIALLMCILIAMSAVIFNNASAADGVSKIDSYASLVENYGTETGDDGLTDGFVYVGTEFYEEDGTLTDYIVSPGDKLTLKVYLKSNMYTSDCNLITLFDNTFFDVKLVDDNAPTDAYGYTSMHESAVINSNHPMVIEHGITHTVTSKNLNGKGLGAIQKFCGFAQEYLENTDLVQNTSVINPEKADTPYEMTSDEWIFSYYVYVKDGLAAGTKGVVDSPEVIWQSVVREINGETKHDPRMLAKVPVRHITYDVENAGDFSQMAFEMDDGSLDYFIIDDMYHVFTVEGESESTTDYYEEPTIYYPDEPETEYPTAPVITLPEISTTPVEFPSDEPVVTRAPGQTVVDDGNETTSAARVYIKTPSVTEIKYGDCIILHADAQNLPEGAELVWSADNSNFIYSCSIDRRTCTIYPSENGSTVFTVKVIDGNGNVLCEDEQVMTSKASFIWRIIAFFKQLFGLNRIIEQVFKF